MAEGLPTQRASAVIDLAAIEHNCARLCRTLDRRARLCAVVKADGYGHGARECAGAAMAGGAQVLAVATASEAWELRQAFDEVPILIMGALGDAELDVALGAHAEIGVWRLELLHEIAERAEALDIRPSIHVKYDTGMGRLGEHDPQSVRSLVERCAEDSRLELAGLWTHFATADEPDQGYLREQLAQFLELAEPLKQQYPQMLLHAANSAATLSLPEAHLDMVRCGVAVYGLDPFGEDAAAQELEPALTLASYVAAVKRFLPGESAGYGRRWRAEGETWIGVIPIGYGDGVRRGLTNNAEVLVGGRRYPLVGTVSMDNITIDLGAETEVEQGATAVLVGEQGGERISAEDLARALGTINYEITCGISARVPRLHLGRRAA